MVKGENGILGNFIGSVANVTGYIRKGQQIIRKSTSDITKPPSLKQLTQRKILSVVGTFNKKILSFLRVGFHLEEIESAKTANNIATAGLMKNAVEGTYPDLYINYSKAVLTYGKLPLSANIKMEKTNGGLIFTWKYDWETEEATDQVMLVVYPHNELKAICVLSGARRAEGKHLLSIPASYKGCTADTWLSFISDDRNCIATSVHTGQIIL
jgi:hypothetical protein